MAEPSSAPPHDELQRQLFYMLTTRFEDGAAIAAEGQAIGIAPDARIVLANRLHALAQEAVIVADAVLALSSALGKDAA
ncbi:hypothetical protein [Sphingomonas profundi]|uniref:hypothetical protein n=1 Tax=Alterirhizorhabdus profundi TaxID=2681549 RepID=UPI0012E7C3B2|nr:hypothetical protein [Sphingomonas profundi]